MNNKLATIGCQRVPLARATTALALALVLFALCSPASADYLLATRKAPLKAAPSASAAPTAHVEAGQVLPLASDTLSGNYYQVAFPAGSSSWVYRGFVTRQQGDPPTPAPPSAGHLKVHVINVGQGDAILITCPDGDHQLLIDSGDTRYPGSAKAFQNAMTELQPKADPIEVVVSTHPHADHIGSMDWVLRQYEVKLYVDDGLTYDSAKFKSIESAIHDRGVHREHVSSGSPPPSIRFCPRPDVSAVILRPESFGDLSDPNDDSVVVRVDYGKESFLFVGDTEKEEEAQLLSDPAVRAKLDCDFLKVGHHGSDTSSTKAFLDAVTPQVAVISCGQPGVSTNAGYMHPRRSTVERLLQYVRGDAGPAKTLRVYDADAQRWTGIAVQGEVHCTSLEGDLVFESDGSTITCHPGP